jgi:hypothetical protein
MFKLWEVKFRRIAKEEREDTQLQKYENCRISSRLWIHEFSVNTVDVNLTRKQQNGIFHSAGIRPNR